MKLIIAGARDLFLTNQLIGFFVSGFRLKPSMVLSGASGFVDKAGEYWATAEGIPVKRFVADWEAQGRAAGPIRNVEMAELGDVLLLIWRGDSPGSASMKREMEKLKKPVYEVIFKTPVEKK